MSGKDETDVVYTINEGKALRSSNQINKTHLTLIGEIRDMSQIVNWKTHPKLRILDSLIVVSLSTFVIQIVYMFVEGTKDPLNAVMAGCFCSLGQFALSGK